MKRRRKLKKNSIMIMMKRIIMVIMIKNMRIGNCCYGYDEYRCVSGIIGLRLGNRPVESRGIRIIFL